MASRQTAEKWLEQLTNLPTAPGLEGAVVDWVTKWARRRDDLRLEIDSGGNVLLTQKGRKTRDPVLAVAHMDHPAFVLTGDDGSFEFRGGVDAPYFKEARIRVVSRPGGPSGVISSYDPQSQSGSARFNGSVVEGDIAMWQFRSVAQKKGLFRAPACDDLAGAAAALAALDRARGDASMRHFGVLLTRAEEVGLIGAIHSAKHRTIPERSRILSIETSRALPTAPIGKGPIIRIGDAATVFDNAMSNSISRAVRLAGLRHQRKLMDGGSCEATAFAGYGYAASGLCVALGNWHNRGNLDQVESGDHAAAVPKLEEISLDDFHGLVDLLAIAVSAVDADDTVTSRLDRLYESNEHYLR